jgi:hypothetical protein
MRPTQASKCHALGIGTGAIGLEIARMDGGFNQLPTGSG